MMNASSTTTLVSAAQRGDREAFGALVTRHERACLGYARVLLPDPATAADAVQDALIDAWLHLHQLREPAAFAGWLRRAVFKHCDRQRRRVREVATAEPFAASAPTGPDALDEAGRWAGLRAAIEALPEHERVVVAMHYLGGAPVAEIAAFLEVSVAAVKKRLFSARQRLVPLEVPVNVDIPALSDPVSLFLALRAGDVPEVRRVLRVRPDLVHAEEGWTDDEALAGGFPLAHPLAPLALAAALGDLPLVRVLLAAGAYPDGKCGCANGESAVWTAARHGHADVVGALLAAGADPAAPHRSGLGLADLAAWRGDPALAALAAGRSAEAAPRERPLSAFAVTATGEVHTGIGALDLWAPLRRHDRVRLEGAAETGLTVLLSELAWAVGAAGGHTVWTSWVPRPWHARELQTVAARGGVERWVEVLTPATTALSAPEDVVPAALARLGAPRTGPLVHVVFEQEGHAADLTAHLPQLAPAADLTVLVRPWAAVTRGEPADEALAAALDATVATDRRLAALGLWPAIDPLRTRARRAESGLLAEARSAVAELAQRDPTLRGDVAHAGDQRARRLLAVLTQPFQAAMPDTGWAGASWSRAALEERVAGALSGRWDAVEERALRYRHALDHA
jgi:RNA polymerase sigma factor (sigma-70 family)